MVTLKRSRSSTTGIPKWKPNETAGPGPAAPDVANKQDPNHTEADFMRDLGKIADAKKPPRAS